MKQLLHRLGKREHVVIFSAQKTWRSYYSENKDLKGQYYATTKLLSVLGPEPAQLAKHCFFLLTKLKVCWSLEKSNQWGYSIWHWEFLLPIKQERKTYPCYKLRAMRKCRASCLLCKYHASKIDSSFHNWLNWGLALFQTHQHEVLTSVHGSAFSTFYSFYSTWTQNDAD